MVSKGNRYPNLRTLLFAKKFKMGGKFVKEYLRTVSGVPCVLTNSVGKPTVNYKIYGETYQSTEMYNPVLKDKDGYFLLDSENYLLCSNDVPQYIIESVGDKTDENGFEIPIITSGKNLWNAELTDGYDLGSIGLPIVNNKRCATLNPIYYTDIDNLKISYKATYPDTHVMYSVFNDNTFIRRLNCMSGDTIDVSGGNRIFFSFYWVGITVLASDISEIQLELGDTVTEYEPYFTPIRTPIYINEPLRKIDDYADIIDFERGVLERKIAEHAMTGEENLTIYSDTLFSFDLPSSLNVPSSVKGPLKCSHYVTCSQTDFDSGRVTTGVSTRHGQRIIFGDEGIISVEDFKAYLKEQYETGTPVTLYYVLAESITESPTLTKFPTINGTTIISVDTEIQPSNLEITYISSKGE